MFQSDTHCQQVLNECKPYYDLFMIAGEFIQTAIPVLQTSGQFSTLSNYPELTCLFLELLANLIKIVLVAQEMGPEKKWIAAVYQQAWLQQHNQEPIGWFL